VLSRLQTVAPDAFGRLHVAFPEILAVIALSDHKSALKYKAFVRRQMLMIIFGKNAKKVKKNSYGRNFRDRGAVGCL
jgi:hypothetical protein